MTSFGVKKSSFNADVFFAKFYQYLRWLLQEQSPVNEKKKKPSVEKYDYK